MIDIGEMVRMAKERADQRWVVVSISEMSNPDDGRFCKDAPGTILHFAEHVASLQEYVGELQQRIAELEAQNATLQAAGGWRGMEELPRINERVLCFTSAGAYEVMRRAEQWWVWLDDIGRTRPASHVAYWQPLPDPPVYIEP